MVHVCKRGVSKQRQYTFSKIYYFFVDYNEHKKKVAGHLEVQKYKIQLYTILNNQLCGLSDT